MLVLERLVNRAMGGKFNPELCHGKSVEYRFIEFFVFDFGSLPYLLSLFLWPVVTFPFVALNNKIYKLAEQPKRKEEKKPMSKVFLLLLLLLLLLLPFPWLF